MKRGVQLSVWSKINNTSEVMRERSYMRKNIKQKDASAGVVSEEESL